MRKSSFYKRMTKSNPWFRNDQGHYLPDKWTAISDVSKVFADQRPQLDESWPCKPPDSSRAPTPCLP